MPQRIPEQHRHHTDMCFALLQVTSQTATVRIELLLLPTSTCLVTDIIAQLLCTSGSLDILWHAGMGGESIHGVKFPVRPCIPVLWMCVTIMTKESCRLHEA